MKLNSFLQLQVQLKDSFQGTSVCGGGKLESPGHSSDLVPHPHCPTLPPLRDHSEVGIPKWLGSTSRQLPGIPLRDSCFSQPCLSNAGLPRRLREGRQGSWRTLVQSPVFQMRKRSPLQGDLCVFFVKEGNWLLAHIYIYIWGGASIFSRQVYFLSLSLVLGLCL